MRAGAFFDIDHTLISADSGMLFVRYLVNRGLMSWTELLGPAYYTVLYRLNLLNINAVYRRYQERFRGQDHSEMQRLCAEWYAGMVRPRIYPAMAAKVQEHQNAGHVVAFLSSATTYVAEPLAQELGVQHLLVNRLVVENGCLTGEVLLPLCWGEGKRHWLERFVLQHEIDLTHSYFYSDSVADLPVLNLVGYPRAVNPDRFLRRHARSKGWTIIMVGHGTGVGGLRGT